jgi:membrane-bound acyltransferase YfiQ involved in biofilm formation
VDAFQGITYTPVEYLGRFVVGGADEPYFFVPILCQFYLISPLLIPLAKTHSRFLIVIAACLQLAATSFRYLDAFLEQPSAVLDLLLKITPVWSFMPWTFFFAFGLVVGFHLGRLTRFVARYKWLLLFATVVLLALTMFEAEVMSRITGEQWESVRKLSSSLYATAFILCFMHFAKILDPVSKQLFYMGRRSYGIYLTQGRVLNFAARAIRRIAPRALAHPLALFTPVLIAAGLGLPLLAMAVVAKSPARKFYRHLFG